MAAKSRSRFRETSVTLPRNHRSRWGEIRTSAGRKENQYNPNSNPALQVIKPSRLNRKSRRGWNRGRQ
jgi:hypothetical protein